MNASLFKKWAVAVVALPFCVVSGRVHAGQKEIVPVQKESVPTEAVSRWRISSGVMMRSIHTEFAIYPRASDFGLERGGSERLFGSDLNPQE